jgi:hypothetical protein
LLIVLSAGLFAFASSLRLTALTRNQDVARRQVGADWRLVVGAPTQGSSAARRLDANSTLVFDGSALTSVTPPAFANAVGVDPSTYGSGGWWQPQDAVDPLSTLLRTLKAPELGIGLPAGTSAVSLRVAAPAVPGFELWAVTQDSAGVVTDRNLG